jgi:uncharacterized glyoxalase superfamily protein PhnB
VKPTPSDWPRISSSLHYLDAPRMIDWLCDAFGFEVRLKVEGDGGSIVHSELTYGEGVIMVSGERLGDKRFGGADARSPRSVGGANTQSLMVYVDDADAHCAHARAAGATITDPPSVHDYGEDYWSDRSYGALDPEGHLWWFTQRLRSRAP